MDLLAPVRGRLAAGFRASIAGEPERADARARRVWSAPGPRWFRVGDPIWRVHSDSSMFAGGIRALLLQSLYPLAMAGVADHSGFRSDPWGRLQRTSEYIAVTTFAPIETAEKMISAVRSIHGRVVGVAADGRPYAASDPDLLRWVHVAEIESFYATHQAFGVQPLTRAEADLYVAQTALAAKLLGVEDPPMSLAQLHQALDDYRPDLALSAAALDARDFVVRQPPVARGLRPGYAALAYSAAATLPTWAKEMLQLPNHKLGEHVLLKLAGPAAVGGIRWMVSDPIFVADRTGQR